MNAATIERFEFAPPPADGWPRALGLAVLAHLLLIAALTWGLHWKQDSTLTTAEAELWSSVPQPAAPRLQNVPPAPRPATAPPRPAPVERPTVPDPDIVQQREKQERMRKEEQAAAERADEKRQQQQAEKRAQEKREAQAEQKQQALERQREQDKLAQDRKREQDKQAADKKREQDKREQAEKLALEKKKAEQEAKQKAQQQAAKEREEASRQAALAAQRADNLKRMAALAGSGAPNANGTGARSSGPSSSYAGRVSAKVKPNIVFTDDLPANPTAEVEVHAAPDGTIVSRKLTRSSGVPAWDEAVLKALDRTRTLPRDTDGSVPSPITFSFRPRD